jgi:predicted ATPase/DNA-binding NarL/FixJ family response regulator
VAPPLSAGSLPTRLELPARTGSFVGRSQELELALNLLKEPATRLLTFTGASGVGKTRLAIEVAGALGVAFEDGGCFVPLSQVAEPAQVLPAIARSLGFVESIHADLELRLIDELRSRHFLLVLDNFEHVLAAAPVVTALVAGCPDLKILVTSQAAMHLLGERELPVGPLPVPGRGTIDLHDLGASPAVRLFVDRARAVSPDFRLDAANAEATAEICRRLDGLPLAIELAAPRTKVLSPQHMLERLKRPLELLAGGPSDAPLRHQAFRNTLEWSYGLLDEETRDGLLQLCVFPGSFTSGDAERLLSPAPVHGVLDLLGGLVERGLLRRVEAESGETRLATPALIRQLLRERFMSAESLLTLDGRLADLELALVDEAQRGARRRSDEDWLRRMEGEHDNLAAALTYLIAARRTKDAIRLAAWSWRFWFLRGHVDEGRSWLKKALETGRPEVSADATEAMLGAGFSAHYQADYAAADSYFQSALRSAKKLRDVLRTAVALNGLGGLARVEGDYAKAERLYEKALDLCTAQGDKHGIATLLERLGLVRWLLGDAEAAEKSLTTALALAREVDDRRGIVQSLQGLGWVAFVNGRMTAAEKLLGEALDRSQSLGDRWNTARALHSLGLVAYRKGQPGPARDREREALRAANQVGDKSLMRSCLESLAVMTSERGNHVNAAELLGSSAALAESAPELRSAILEGPTLDADYDSIVRTIKARLSEREFEAAWSRGRALTPLQVLDLDVGWVEAVTGEPAGLSKREIMVLRLVTHGMTNGEVARQLFLSHRTVDAHLRTIYRKIGVSSRAAATRFAIEQDIT